MRRKHQIAILEHGVVDGYWRPEEYISWIKLYHLQDGNYEKKIEELGIK